jgi:hypothetical protein
MDYVALAAIIISVGTAISHLHLRKVHLGCIESECYKVGKSQPVTPIEVQPIALSETKEERNENKLDVYINGS